MPYLRDLGISHLCLSPSLQARAGSTHGYDVIDPRRISPALGGEDEFRALAGGEPGVCAYTRGGEMLLAVATRRRTSSRTRGWRDVLGLRGLVLGVPDAG